MPDDTIGTLGELHRNCEPRWLWAYCGNDKCGRSQPIATAPFVIRYGPDAPADILRRSLVCKACGHRGVTTRHPSWGDTVSGWQAFPIEDERDGQLAPTLR